MTRVIAGRAGGRRLATPKGSGTRPTSDRVRESLFAALSSLLGGFEDLHVLDLYAGSGALGIEALSRGASGADFVERDAQAAAVVRANLRELRLPGAVHRRSVRTHLEAAADRPADLVLYDPPYDLGGERVTSELALLVERGHVGPDAVIVVERSARTPDVVWPPTLEALRDKAYGETRLWYGQPRD